MVGEQVLLNTQHIPLKSVGTRKLLMKWMGPFKALAKIGEAPVQVAYKLKLPPQFKIHDVFLASQLKPFDTNGSYHPPPPATLVDNEEEFEVEEILTHKPKGKKKTDPKVKFLIKSAGYEHENNTWEPYKNLRNAPTVLEEYWDRAAVRATQQAKASKQGSCHVAAVT